MLKKHGTFFRFVKFAVVTTIIYFAIKAPATFFLTDILGLHYIISGFIIGSLTALANFIPSEYWIWSSQGAIRIRERLGVIIGATLAIYAVLFVSILTVPFFWILNRSHEKQAEQRLTKEEQDCLARNLNK